MLQLWIGLAAIAISTFVRTAVFASLEKSADVTLQIFVGLLSIFGCGLDAVHGLVQAPAGQASRADLPP